EGMFHWICPECGREIAPTVRECPVCDPVAATVETALAGEVEAPARAGKDAPAPAAETQPEPQPQQPIAPVVAPATATAIALAPPVLAAPSALAARIESVSPLAARNGPSVANQNAGEDALLPQFGAPPGGGNPLDHLSSMLVSSMLDSRRDASPPEPPASRDALPLPMRAACNVPASLRAFIAELRPAGAEPRIPLTPDRPRRTAPEPPLLTKPLPLPLRPSRQAPAPPSGAKLLALPLPPQEAAQPSTRPWEPAPPLAPLGNYSPLEGRPLRPAVPKLQLLKKECGPRNTLPGPMLTRRLVKFMDRELGSIPPAFLVAKKRLIPGWMVTALILGTLLGAGFTSVISMVRPAAEAKPSPIAQTNLPAAPLAAMPEVSSVSAAPLAKAIEVTGFRIQMDPAKKSEIQYLVVNHTPARFSGVTVYVTLYTSDAKAGQPPLCKFQFTAPNLAPFQSKDMTSAIERVARPVSLPDWQDLRATVEIGE
ncbi:MAG TPA: hypothetical protein VGS58_10925, partial [Candidatus Sulfopaludibacter sp.]|nr:hypothetical protein [Candidatus Sulfopaludibacter sp.]